MSLQVKYQELVRIRTVRPNNQRLEMSVFANSSLGQELLWAQVSAVILDQDFHPVMIMLPNEGQVTPAQHTGSDRVLTFVSKRDIGAVDLPFFVQLNAVLEMGANRRELKHQQPIKLQKIQRISHWIISPSPDADSKTFGIFPTNELGSPLANSSFTGPTLVVTGETDGTYVTISYTCPGPRGASIVITPVFPTGGSYSQAIEVPCLGWGTLCVTAYNAMGESTTVCIPVNRVS